MKLPTRVRYAVRAIVELAERGTERPVSIRAIADAQSISPKYAKQLMNKLQRAGIVKGHAGIHGGYTLRRSPDEINLLEIYDALDVSVKLVPCIRSDSYCERSGACAAQLIWQRLSEELTQILRNTSIGEMVAYQRSLRGRR